MADDSWDIETVMDFHPSDKSHGMKDYSLEELTTKQKIKLNVSKREQIRDDKKYLAAHPEVRGLTIMILRLLMKSKPQCDIYKVVGNYFTKSSVDLKEEVNAYLDERAKILGVNSRTGVIPRKESTLSMSFEQEGEGSAEEQSENESIEYRELQSLIFEHNEDVEKAERKENEIYDNSSAIIICRKTLDDILEIVHDEVNIPSLDSSIESGPADYVDHDIQTSSDDSSTD